MFNRRPTDRQLITNLRAGGKGEERALGQIYHQHKGMVVQLILKNGGSEEQAKDIFQEAVIDLYENVRAERFRGESAISSYLYAIARNKWFNRLKRKKVERRIIDTQSLQPPSEPIEVAMLAEEKKAQVMALFDQLGPACKELLIYAIYYYYSIPDIQKKLNYNSEQVVRNQKYRCLKKLKEMIKEQPELIRFLKP